MSFISTAGKTLIVVLLGVCFIITIGCGPSKKQQRTAIEQILKKTSELENQRDANLASLDSNDKLDNYNVKIRVFIQESKEIVSNTKGVPEDFSIAYNDYLNAWGELSQTIAAHPDFGFWSNVLKGAIRGFLGDPTGGAVEAMAECNSWEKTLQENVQQIDATSKNVEKTALEYGAKIE